MATINDLAISISELSDQQVFDLIKKRRFARRVQKESNKKAVAKTRPKKTVNVAAALGLLSEEQKQALMKELLK